MAAAIPRVLEHSIDIVTKEVPPEGTEAIICTICQEILMSDQTILGHGKVDYFHSECLASWLATPKRNPQGQHIQDHVSGEMLYNTYCPNCRAKFSTPSDELMKLFPIRYEYLVKKALLAQSRNVTPLSNIEMSHPVSNFKY